MSVVIGKDSTVCAEAELSGNISIGEHVVVHPKARIVSSSGKIDIGDYCVIEEHAVIECTGNDPVVIGSHNKFEVGCKVTNPKRIGNANVFHTQCVISEGVTLGNGCTIGVRVVVPANTTYSNNTVLTGVDERYQREDPTAEKAYETEAVKHAEVLQKTLPHFHHLQK